MMFKSLVTHLRHDGTWHTALCLADSCRRVAFGIYEIVRRQVAEPQSSIQFAWGYEALNRYRQGRTDLPSEFYLDVTKGARNCLLATLAGEAAAILWIHDDNFPSKFIQLKPNEVEVGYLQTLPHFRGRGLAKALVGLAVQQFEGRRVFAVIDDRNISSRTVFSRTGFRRIFTLTRRGLWGPRYTSDSEPECHSAL